VAIPTVDLDMDLHTIGVLSQIMGHRSVQDAPPALKIAIRPKVLSHLQRLGPPSLPPLDPVAHWVTSLELDQLDLSKGVQFWHLVLEFPKLKSLILGCVDGGAEVPISSHHELEICHISLKHTALDGSCNICLFLVENPLPLPYLTSLDVRFPTALDSTAVRFAGRYGATVKKLRFGAAVLRYLKNKWDKLARKF